VDDNVPFEIPLDEDADVTQERRRVLRGRGRKDLLQLKNLSKVRVLMYSWYLVRSLLLLSLFVHEVHKPNR